MAWLTVSFSTNHDSFPQYRSHTVLEAKMPDTKIHFFEHSLMKYPWIIFFFFLRRKIEKKKKKKHIVLWWGIRQMTWHTVFKVVDKQGYLSPSLKGDIMASEMPINLPSPYLLPMLHPSLSLASLWNSPTSSFCLQCCSVSWESERKTSCALPHIEWYSSTWKSTCKSWSDCWSHCLQDHYGVLKSVIVWENGESKSQWFLKTQILILRWDPKLIFKLLVQSKAELLD